MTKLRLRATAEKRNESDAWLETYADQAARTGRRNAMPAKLQRLGLLEAPRNVRLLDMCCGHGEALECLHSLGFSDLTGMDLTVTEELASDGRFRVLSGDVTATGLEPASYDWITCIHSLHHLGNSANVERLLNESWRLLRPGGRLSLVDFPASPQIKLAFRFFRVPQLHWTPYLKYFGKIIQEEWHFLRYYLPEWPKVRRLIWNGRFNVERSSRSLFYYYVTLRKPHP